MKEKKELERKIAIFIRKHLAYPEETSLRLANELIRSILKDYVSKSEVDKLRKELDDAKTDFENCKDYCPY